MIYHRSTSIPHHLRRLRLGTQIPSQFTAQISQFPPPLPVLASLQSWIISGAALTLALALMRLLETVNVGQHSWMVP